MLEKISVLAKASDMARHASARHRVIAENVANADTPGYRARDLRPFSELVNAGGVNEAFTPRATRPEHLLGQAPGRPAAFEPVVRADRAAPNGNSVSLETESIMAVETQGDHSLALGVYSKAVDILRIGLGRSR
ncbi:FlgB family protein [Paralimibaculum aggregatum]|uniref:FlgB family protein n=1 Tax=Paralimibaculum aggregatum TaxID=3036245 RepID=A0ABQ6LK47_9RHOB|nr:FlgB family protein [Limibaculum sp. NKW23]GMG83628.1 FlgB family protein [Limibaculum sp. NKW23]